ncbi:hypothetical protein [Condylorrhiza vestigialis mutiple nucleopolyhedrovirus]|uniref:ChaB-like protein n=1 Tax=Condylorrhiza vestigialis mutiple nucleopolyhedrovirus TaxID=1592576 RepID=A0A0B4UL69_9ABAC|nr:hypothetical protein [Condylorrhiza vestigialis mutiple nucleopolyhedrovirus]AJD09252.1 hypothetical protein [Condylorrhiza vestigialis mutiple nucleopolyhedrovirus]
MYHIPDTLYEEKMPRRAKQLFVDTFSKHHKLNAGDEDSAMQKARHALEERYVRVNDLQWIPRRAAYEIIRDDMSDDSDGVQNQQINASVHKRKNTRAFSTSSDSETSSAYETDDKLGSTSKIVRSNASRKKRVKGKIPINKHYNNKSQPHYSSGESHSDEDDY